MNYQLAIIGGGPAGYTAAEVAGKAGLKVILFEKKSLGGVCLNEGCIPTKTLLYAAKMVDSAKHATKYAVQAENVTFDLPKMIQRKQKVVRKLVLGIKAKMTAAGVEVINGEAIIEDAHTIRCNDTLYSCESLLIATGSETFIPPIPGLDQIAYWTHYDALENKEVPQSLLIVGGGVIGMEFAAFFSNLGVEVTVVEMADEILGGIDAEIAAALRDEYTKKGIRFLLQTKVTGFEKAEDGVKAMLQNEDGDAVVSAQRVLLSAGRRPVTTGFGLERLNLEMNERRCIVVDRFMQSSVSGVYVCGDLNGVSLLAHTAVREAEVAVHHLLGKNDEMSYRAIPGVVYTNPEVASVGESEESLQRKAIAYCKTVIPMTYAGRFVAENEGLNGVCKVLTDNEGVLLGVHLMGNPASELIVVAGMLIEDRRKLSDLKRYVFPHPTVGEVLRELD